MKYLLLLLTFFSFTITSFAQFSDTADLNAYLRDTIKDRRPDKVTVREIQKALLGLSNLMPPPVSLHYVITKQDADVLIADSMLSPGAMYIISGVDKPLYVEHSHPYGEGGGDTIGNTIILQAITNHSFSSEGYGQFFVPRYGETYNGSDIIHNIAYEYESIWYGGGFLVGNVFVIGNYYATGISLSNIFRPTYLDWGGYETPYSRPDIWKFEYDKIKYDYAHDYISMREDSRGNRVQCDYDTWLLIDSTMNNDYSYSYRPISVFKWGSDLVRNNIVEGGYFETINSNSPVFSNYIQGAIVVATSPYCNYSTLSQDFTKWVFKNSAGLTKVKYYDESDAVIIFNVD